MGQTLSHGVYLPNEGERNCYAGLASNWQILNTAVGAIAEKAPLVHTHTVSQITDFPAYGNAAGTICEGNDSRLSDARTPVAHTHTKSDVTDLLNSNFIPSANNSYDLGSSSYQWKNVYAKKTYTNTIKATTDILTLQSNGTNNSIAIHNGTAAADGGGFWAYGKDHPNGSSCRIQIYNTSKSRYERVDLVNSQFLPTSSGEIDLGTSTNKWKTLNGINPGALSIFNPSASYDPIDIPTSWNTSGTSWNTLSVSNLGDGWICITYNNCSAGDYILARFGGTNGSRYPSLRFEAVKGGDNKYYIYALFPVAKAFSNIYLEMLINSNANLVLHHYIPAYGTV